MQSDWPSEIPDFEKFLERSGLRCQRREEEAVFGNKLLQYGRDNVGVRMISDRGVWFVEVADLGGRPNNWYDTALLRDLLDGPGKRVLTLIEQIQFIQKNWNAISGRFTPTQRNETHDKLDSLKGDRARRMFPDFYS